MISKMCVILSLVINKFQVVCAHGLWLEPFLRQGIWISLRTFSLRKHYQELTGCSSGNEKQDGNMIIVRRFASVAKGVQPDGQIPALTMFIGICFPFSAEFLSFFSRLVFAPTTYFMCIILGVALMIVAPIGGLRKIIVEAKTRMMNESRNLLASCNKSNSSFNSVLPSSCLHICKRSCISQLKGAIQFSYLH
ncbi:hypothetical protein QVD17_09601 [Tagetes erecta]|uniref:Uncharacterized protein n=1 Tax=Tagetes erecta TaxID=13708 RepID=A0AAD8L184_TARER|nr:hypothetical protein QVD17_09601 [Tagetes erecta]